MRFLQVAIPDQFPAVCHNQDFEKDNSYKEILVKTEMLKAV